MNKLSANPARALTQLQAAAIARKVCEYLGDNQSEAGIAIAITPLMLEQRSAARAALSDVLGAAECRRDEWRAAANSKMWELGNEFFEASTDECGRIANDLSASIELVTTTLLV